MTEGFDFLRTADVLDRVQMLDTYKVDYPLFSNFHLGEFVKANIEGVPTLRILNDQVYFVIWLALNVDVPQSDPDPNAAPDEPLDVVQNVRDLLSLHNRRLNNDVYEHDMVNFLVELNDAIRTEIPPTECGEELGKLRSFIEADAYKVCGVFAQYQSIFETFLTDNKIVSWAPRRYVHILLLLTPQSNFCSYIVNNPTVKRVCRRVNNAAVSFDDWMVIADATKEVLLNRAQSALHDWAPQKAWRDVNLGTGDDFEDLVRMTTVYRHDWQKMWTLRGWRINLRLKKAIQKFKRSNPQLIYQGSVDDRITWLLKHI